MNLITAAEVPLLIPQAKEFFAEGEIDGKLDEKNFVKMVTANIEAGTMFVLAEGVPFRGAIAGVTYKDVATGDVCCMEHFWYVNQHERGSLGLRLLSAFENEAKARGAVRILMMHHVAPGADKFHHLYERRGYRLREQIFVKVA